MTTTTRHPIVASRAKAFDLEAWVMRSLLGLGALWLVVGVVLPLFPIVIRSFQNTNGEWVSLANYG
jgi:hypothetical protein